LRIRQRKNRFNDIIFFLQTLRHQVQHSLTSSKKIPYCRP